MAATTPPLRRPVLVRGTGSIGSRYLTLLAAMADYRPLAWPLRPERAGALEAAGFDVTDGQVTDLPDKPVAAIVATDTGRHVADALTLLDDGLPLLVEKPLAPDGLAASVLVNRARAGGGPVYVAAPLRFAAALQALRTDLPTIGPLHAVRITCQSYLPDWRPGRDHRTGYAARPDEGGVLRDLIHEIDYAGWLFGWPQAVFARLQDGQTTLGIASDAGADLLWTTADGISVSLRLDYLTRTPTRDLRVHGRDGDLIWDVLAQTLTRSRPGQAAETRYFPQDSDALLAAQTRTFLAAVAGAAPAPLATLDDGLRALAVCDAARRSAASGRLEATGLEGVS